MESLKGTTRGEDLYGSVSGVIERLKLPWCKLANVTTDGSPNLTGKKVGLLKRIQDKFDTLESLSGLSLFRALSKLDSVLGTAMGYI
ncbi:hypothetical protein JOQ06_023448 [Pogonophryne albipinna]|uniref:Uncharacterized protein n=1 Tax=Pogonophryne albipinna TaxID=1090488 RepID=A0AAD6FSU0_9TELE|nr:hypothetical protein JOQ06_023448 [Pogonophryne albipinna]